MTLDDALRLASVFLTQGCGCEGRLLRSQWRSGLFRCVAIAVHLLAERQLASSLCVATRKILRDLMFV
ncbi:MAG: hypothetical protein JRD94_16930 [Deltaproteobacteria bacterium]|nr:hypothetical protein [Deltaproteobacteria bacterium]